MDEQGLRSALRRLAAADAPPSRVDIGLARRRGRGWLRWRRAGAGAVPVVAAAVAVAVVTGTGLPFQASGVPGGNQSSAQAPHPPRRFNPLTPYAAYGWLPAGTPGPITGTGYPTQVILSTTRAGHQFLLTVWVPGACSRDAAQVRQALAGHSGGAGLVLSCVSSSLPAGWQERIARPAAAVDGRPAFWTRAHTLAWEYAPDAWATLTTGSGAGTGTGTASNPGGGPGGVPAATVLKVAGHVRYDAAGMPSVDFPYRLTGLTGQWPVAKVTWTASPGHGYLAGRTLVAGPAYLAVGPVQGPLAMQGPLAVTPGSGNCSMRYGSKRVTLNGAKAVVTLMRQKGVPSASQTLCVPGYHGLSVVMMLQARADGRFPLGGVTGIFLHHLHLLGPDPVHWTTHPLP